MSVAALPPPSLQPRMAMPAQSKRPVMMPRPSASSSSSSTPALAARPPAGLKAKPAAAPPPIVRRPSSAASSTPRSNPVALPQPAAGSSKDTSSSSGKVFAKPSKEWVLPERAKPGRKVSVEEPDNKRQSQNRLSQRAHRARRTDYIQTLEERLRQYEADEIHSNVRLQEVARALKADNERLKKEVVTLRMDLNEMATQRDGWESERSSYEDLVGRLRSELHSLRGSDAASPHFIRHQHSNKSSPLAMPTLVPNTDRRPTMDCPICPDPDPDCPCQQRGSAATMAPPQHTPSAPLVALHLAVKAMAEQDPSPTPGGDACGVCSTDDECLCRAIDDMEEDVKPVIFPTPSPESDLLGGVDFGGPVGDGCGLCTSASFCACRANASSNGSSQSPIMGLSTMVATSSTTVYPTPPYSTAAVPLKLRRAQNKSKSIWALEPAAPSPPKRNDDAMCSGDPSNCEACRDDSFGKEFCSNLFEKAEAEPAFKPCTDCPGNCMSIQSLLGPSVSPQATTSALAAHDHPHDHVHDRPAQTTTTYTAHAHGEPAREDAEHETMTCDQAWKALKAHPNSRFASLALLADVVAGRTVCTGPKADNSAASPLPGSPVQQALAQEIGVGAPKARTKPLSTGSTARASPSPGPGSLAAPIARKHNMAVETSAVRDALRLLDKTPAPSPGLSAAVPQIRVGSHEPDAEPQEGRDAKRRKVEV